MRETDRWVIVDTETTGLKNPVYPVEIAAQRMIGWRPEGPPMRVLLNFDVPIERMAEKIHGYSREYLREHGIKPAEGLTMFARYACGLPLVSYNLAFDWNRVLRPIFENGGAENAPREGFCALCLTRNLIPDLPDFKLKTVAKALGIMEDQTHHAADDVQAVVSLLSRFEGPHLSSESVAGFDRVCACSQGQLPVKPMRVDGTKPKRRSKRAKLRPEELFAIGQLNGICRMIILDRQYTADELNFLAKWLEECPHTDVEPLAQVFELVRGIVADKVVTGDEKRQLTAAIEQLLDWRPPTK